MIPSVSSPVVPRLLPDSPVGANPIIWSNDDFADLNGDLPLEVILSEMQTAGYTGTELGHAYPRSVGELRSALGAHGLRLVSGWHSCHLADRDYDSEEALFREHLNLLKGLGTTVLIIAECTRSIHGDRTAALGFDDADRSCLTADEWGNLTSGLGKFAAICAKESIALAYHHHVGTVIQSAAELDRLLAAVPALQLLLDPGHLALAGIDPLSITRKYGARVAHVHLKSVRPGIVERTRRERWSFYRAVCEGVFTIPGDGSVDFPEIFTELDRHGYTGWLVVEAEEDPSRAPPFAKAVRAREFVRNLAGA